MCSFGWLSVIVKRGLSIILPRTVVKIELDKNFGELMVAADPNEVVVKVTITVFCGSCSRGRSFSTGICVQHIQVLLCAHASERSCSSFR